MVLSDIQLQSETARTVATYKAAVVKHFDFFKETERIDDVFAKGIRLGEKGMLVPLCRLHCQDENLIADLAKWRQEHADAFPSQFPVTIEGTRNWIRDKVLAVPDRMLFLVLDSFGNRIGHLGFANALNDNCTLEIDNVVRGVDGTAPGLMQAAMKELITWAQLMLLPQEVYLRVFSDNQHAVSFYERSGFQRQELLPLKKRVNGQSILFEKTDNPDEADRYFLRMIHRDDSVWSEPSMILTAGPLISAREVSYALDAARTGWNSNWSKYLNKFEQAFASYIGCKYAMATSSCTGALHIALMALGIGPGDEVIVPDITWVATANAARYVGATPVFVDVQKDTWCMDPVAFEQAITPRTKAVIPVHLYGHPARLDQIVTIANRHGIKIVEDAAPAIGAEINGRRVGTFGDFAAFSFQGAKLVVSGEGGMLVTNDEKLYERAKSIWDQGRDPHKTFWILETGVKYKMSNIQAAIGLGQFERVDEMVEAKRRLFKWYEEAGLNDLPGVSLFHEAPWARSIYWMISILLSESAEISSEAFRQALRERSVDTRPVFPAIRTYPMWHNNARQNNPVADAVAKGGINLPSGICLTRAQVNYVVEQIKDVLKKVR